MGVHVLAEIVGLATAWSAGPVPLALHYMYTTNDKN